MTDHLEISIGQYSDKGRKEINQDFHGALFPQGPLLATKGISVAIADGISTSSVSQIAAETTIKSFLTDYYCTSETWSVKTSSERVISASNSWAYAQTKRSQHAYDLDKGYVCTFSAIVFKARQAHIVHVGDSRIYRLAGGNIEQLTNDHRVIMSSSENYLGRAIGMAPRIEIDYRATNLSIGEFFILATDGIYEHLDEKFISHAISDSNDDLDNAAKIIAEEAISRGSTDNLTIQIVRIDTIPDVKLEDFAQSDITLPAPPILQDGQEFEGFKILRELHANHRSHVYLARHIECGELQALKIPSMDLREDKSYLRRFMLEDWIARRISNAHVLKPGRQQHARKFAFITTEYVEGITLSQWMIDNPKPDIEEVRVIVEQIAKALRAFHRKEMIHQDLRPQNIMIDKDGTVKIIDFGATKVAGVLELSANFADKEIAGTLQYTAPELFIGAPSSRVSDFFSLGVITYQMLSGKLPYGTQVAKIRNEKSLRKLKYANASRIGSGISDWIDGALQKATHPEPNERYETLTEFLLDLRTPNKKFLVTNHTPLAERNPVAFWQGVSLVLFAIIVILMFW